MTPPSLAGAPPLRVGPFALDRHGPIYGGLLATLEAALTYGSGAVVPVEVVGIILFGLGAGIVAGLTAPALVAAAARVAPAWVMRDVPLCLLVALLGARGIPPVGSFTMQALGVALLLTSLAGAGAARLEGVSDGRRLARAALWLALAETGVAVRTLRDVPSLWSVALVQCAAIAVVGIALVAWLAGRRRLVFIGAAVVIPIAVAALAGRALPLPAVPTVDRPGPARQPSGVLLIVLDTVRRDHVSLYGYHRPTSPNIDRLAQNAVVFERAYSTSHFSLPAHASLFTGRMPIDHGANAKPVRALKFTGDGTDWMHLARQRVHPDLPTLAEELGNRGYATAGITANHGFLADWTGLKKGFRSFMNTPRRLYGYTPSFVPLARRLGYYEEEIETWPANQVTDAAIRWLDQSRGSAQRFLFLNYMDAHPPYESPLSPGEIFSDMAGKPPRRVDAYDAAIAFADQHLGRLFRHLAAMGEDWVVVITSDHGEFLGDHGLQNHESELYESVLRVPLIVKLPGTREGRRVTRRVGLHHVLGMILGYVDRGSLDLPPDTDDPEVFAEKWTPPLARAVYQGRFKLIERLDGNDALYDLEADPREQRNLLADGSAEGRQQRQLMVDKLPELGVYLDARVEPAQLDAVAMERLRALGYVQ